MFCASPIVVVSSGTTPAPSLLYHERSRAEKSREEQRRAEKSSAPPVVLSGARSAESKDPVSALAGGEVFAKVKAFIHECSG